MPLLLDLFCGAGGAAMGYYRAGFEVIGVDNVRQPHYPFRFHQADAMEYLRQYGQNYDIIHASVPCQPYTKLARIWIARLGRQAWTEKHPELIVPVRTLLRSTRKPYVIENVIGAPLYHAIMLCGAYFGLKVYRHRLFESNKLLFCPDHTPHRDNCPEVGRGLSDKGFLSITGRGGFGFPDGLNYARHAMGIDWEMDRAELSQAVPPAYTEFIGRQLLRLL